MENRHPLNSVLATLKTIVWILKLVYRFCPILIIVLLITQLLSAVVPFAEQKYLSNLIDSLITSFTSKNNFWVNIFVIFFAIRTIKIVILILQRTFQRILDLRVQNELRKYYLHQTSSLDYQQFEDPHIAGLISKVNEEYGWRTRQVISDIFDLIVQTISFSTVMILLLPHYWQIALILFIGELPGLFNDKKWQKLDWKTFNHYSELSRPGWDAIRQLTDKRFTAELKINQATNWLKSKLTDIQDEFTQVRVSQRRQLLLPGLLASLFSAISGGICMLFIIRDINQGLLSIGMFTFYFGIIRNTGDYFSSILSRFVSIGEQSLYINNFKTITQLPSIINNGHLVRGITHAPLIEFKDVSFHYPHSHKYIFHHLNLIIQPGEEIAIVGPNGAGKSTLIKLLCRFYDPTGGDIFINHINLKDYDLNYWYRHLSLLTQEFNVYPNLNLKENIAMTNNPDQKKIVTALKKSEAYEFVKKYPQGFDTMMSHRYHGEEPSWGQWQKIAIARIFYRNTPIMILDEPTASIDAVAESKIFSRLYKQITHKTLMVVSHRFSTVRNAQRIIVIDQGQIVEQGSHEELLSLKGLYSKSFHLQAKGYQA